jgi:molecular chaperone Hsp33
MGSSEGFRASDPSKSDWDQVQPFQLDALGVRGRLVRLGSAIDAVIERHGYPLAVARPLAEAMVLCATLASSLKYDGIFTLQISGDGPIRLLVTDLTTDGALRGYAQFDSWKLAVALGVGGDEAPEGYVPKLFGHGRLSFIVDQGQHTERYQGIVPLEGSTLADCAHTYFRQSEQLPTGLKIAARRVADGASAHWQVASLMVQQMPEFDAGRLDEDREQREDDWRKAVILMASATEAEMLDPALPGTTLLHRLFRSMPKRRACSIAGRWSRAAAAAASASTVCCARSSARSSTTCATRAVAWP